MAVLGWSIGQCCLCRVTCGPPPASVIVLPCDLDRSGTTDSKGKKCPHAIHDHYISIRDIAQQGWVSTLNLGVRMVSLSHHQKKCGLAHCQRHHLPFDTKWTPSSPPLLDAAYAQRSRRLANNAVHPTAPDRA